MQVSLVRLIGILLVTVGGGQAKDGEREGQTGIRDRAVESAGELPATEPPPTRVLSKEITVAASLDEVWHCWTTSEGIASFLSTESKVEPCVGGAYEWYFGMKPDSNGQRGSQGCKVLSFIPRDMLSFEWNFPPSVAVLRSSGAKTHVVLRFKDLGNGQIKIRFDQLGWGKGEAWDKGYAYFDRAWDTVLLKLKTHLEGKDRSAPTATTPTKEPVSAEAILRDYVEDFRRDPFASEPWTVGIRIADGEDHDWHVVVTGKKTPRGAYEVGLHSGLPEEPAAYFQMDLITLHALHDGRMNALTAMSKEFSTDPSPMSIRRMADLETTPDFWPDILPRAFHFWTRGLPERVPFGPSLTRETHGVDAALFYYQKGFRSSWIHVRKGQRANENERSQAHPWPSMLIMTRGRLEAVIGGVRCTLAQGEMVFIPGGVSHEFWNPFDQPAEAVLLNFGEGA